MDVKPKKGTEMAMIDCCMIVATTLEDTPRSIASTISTKIGVEPQIETTEAVKLIIKGALKAQKGEKKTITGHTITLTDGMTILELIEILQGGTIERNETGEIVKYTPPVVGTEYKPVKFMLDCYSAQMDEGGNVVRYEKVSYPSCTGQPIGLNSEDDVFRASEYTINSTPGKGEAPYTLEYVDALPEVDESETLGTLTVTSSAGSASGKTAINVSPQKAEENSYKYKTASSVSLPAYGDICSSGYTAWDGIAEISATTGNKILIVEVNSSNEAVKAGTATVTSKV